MRITESENISSSINDVVAIDGGTLGNPNDESHKPMKVVCDFQYGTRYSIECIEKNAEIYFTADTNFQKLYERYRRSKSDNAILIPLKEKIRVILKIYSKDNDDTKLLKFEIKDIIV